MINCYILCKEDDIFNSIVNKVFERKPEFRDFLCIGNVVNEYKSIKENKIKIEIKFSLLKEMKKKKRKKVQIARQETITSKLIIQITIIKNFKKEDIIDEKKNLIILQFLSMAQNIHHSILCKKDEIFSRVIERLLDKYPNYKIKKLAFIVKGSVINENLSVEENNLLDNDIVTVLEIDEY